ncbi:MAG: hypothetical protein KBG15_01730 [Kofleriaceae bacterium]|nr:hypothetical protein [Kofleriaceae bacterium]
MRFGKTSAWYLARQWALALALAVLGCMLLDVPSSWAGNKSAAILRAAGDGGADLQDQLTQVIEKDFGYKVASTRQVTEAMDELGLDDDETSDRPLQKLGIELEVAVVFRVRASKLDNGGHKGDITLIFADKRKTRSFTIYYGARASGTSIDRKLRETLDVVMLGKPAKRGTSGDARSNDDDADDDDQASNDDDDADDRPKKKKKKKRSRDDEDESEDDELSAAQLYAMTHGANRAAIRVDFGPSMVARSLSFNSNLIDNPPRGYSNSPVPGARIAVEFYPLALRKRLGAAAGLGFGLDYDRTLSLSVRVPQTDGSVISLPTAQSRLYADLRYRVVFGNRAASPSLTVIAGYGQRDFSVDRLPLSASGIVLDMPDVGYRIFAPGLNARFPVASAVALGVQARGLLVFDAGAIQTKQEYGQATITGVEANVSIDILLGARFALKVAGDVAVLGYSFTGNGEQSNNRDMDPATKDVGGASDRYLGGSVTMAVLY